MTDGSWLEAIVAAAEAAMRPVLPATEVTTPVVGRTEGVVAEGPSDTTTVAEETSRELSLVLTLGGSHPPMWDEPLL